MCDRACSFSRQHTDFLTRLKFLYNPQRKGCSIGGRVLLFTRNSLLYMPAGCEVDRSGASCLGLEKMREKLSCGSTSACHRQTRFSTVCCCRLYQARRRKTFADLHILQMGSPADLEFVISASSKSPCRRLEEWLLRLRMLSGYMLMAIGLRGGRKILSQQVKISCVAVSSSAVMQKDLSGDVAQVSCMYNSRLSEDLLTGHV